MRRDLISRILPTTRITDQEMTQTIIITGFMGCGKSQVARELARRLDVPMIDLDDRITASEGRTPAELITGAGEPAFRAIETNTLHQLLQSNVTGVIALGGGAWIESANRDLIDLYGCISVWLDTPFAVCWGRISASDDERPLGKTIEEAEARYNLRKPVYALASIHIPVTGSESVDQLVSRVEVQLARVKS